MCEGTHKETHLIEGTLPIVEGGQAMFAYRVSTSQADRYSVTDCKLIAADGTVQKVCP